MTADSTGDGEKSFRERVNEELDEGQIDDDSDKSVREQVSDIREGDGQSGSNSQVSQQTASSTGDVGTGRGIVVALGRFLVVVFGLLLIADALNIVNLFPF